MTTVQIETYANEEGLVVGSSDLDLKVRLRRKVIPKFEMDVGECAWRRVNTSLAFSVGDREKDLPAAFGKLLDGPVFFDSGNNKYPLAYWGEDITAMGLADQSTDTGSPSGYWIIRDGATPSVLKRVRLDRTTDKALTMRYSYISQIQFADDTTSVELTNYIPLELQWALVEGLKLEILTSRLSIDDPRIGVAKAAYDEYVSLAMELREPGMREGTKKTPSNGKLVQVTSDEQNEKLNVTVAMFVAMPMEQIAK